MTTLDLSPLGAEPAEVGRPISRPGVVERVVVVFTMFSLAYGTPLGWFTEGVTSEQAVAAETVDPLAQPMFLVLFGFLLSRLVNNSHLVLRLFGAEPILPLLSLLMVMSALWSADPNLTARRAIATVLTTACAYYLVLRFDPDEIVRMCASSLAVGTVLNWVWVVGLPTYGTDPNGFYKGVTNNKNTLGQLAVLSVLILVVAARSNRRFRLVYYSGAIANVFLLVGTQSKTSLVASALLVFLLIVYQSFRGRRTLFGAIGLAMVSAMITAALVVTATLGTIATSLDKDITLSGRVPLWEALLPFIADRPVLGYGWNGFWTGWWGPSHDVWADNGWSPAHAHNALFDFSLQLGLIGAGLYLLLMLKGMVRAAWHVRLVPKVHGLWPITIISFSIMFSITETAQTGRSLTWLMISVALLEVAYSRQTGRALMLRAEMAGPGAEGSDLEPLPPASSP
ncbi:MAG: O-antigen ligase family protein [Actinomycetia bacterium]|nr:O-antigen ligase family protein [Actinomycetes bacterium]